MAKRKPSSPTYTALAAITLDGKIARSEKSGSNWTSPEDKTFMRRHLDKSDVIIVGHTTYKIAAKPLAKRNCIVLTRGVAGGFEQTKPNLAFCNPAKVNLKKVIAAKGYRRVAVLGGSQIYSYCSDKGMMDELYLTIEPIVFGEGVSLFSRLSKTPKFKFISIKTLNARGTVLMRMLCR